jgi:hypothetical protein
MASATHCLSEMVKHYGARLALADQAKSRVNQDFSLNSVSKLMQARLSLIERQFNFDNDLDGRILDHEVGINETYGF